MGKIFVIVGKVFVKLGKVFVKVGELFVKDFTNCESSAMVINMGLIHKNWENICKYLKYW